MQLKLRLGDFKKNKAGNLMNPEAEKKPEIKNEKSHTNNSQ